MNDKQMLIIFGVIIFIFGGFYFVNEKYLEYKIKLTQKEEQIQNILLSQQNEINKLKDEIGFFRLESGEQVDDLKRKLEAEESIRKTIESERETQNLIADKKIINLEEQISLVGSKINLSSIIESWETKVVYLECDFQLSNSNIHYSTFGSGVLIKFDDLPTKVITNKHVLIGPAFYNLKSCNVRFFNNSTKYYVPVEDMSVSSLGYDWGILDINNTDENIKNITSVPTKICDQKPNLGDEVLVLGYPGIGSKDGVTATEGIISGFDGNYFITSAKVEQGNSGGAAILQKESCLLGIPTYASLGQVESLARILDIWTVLIKN